MLNKRPIFIVAFAYGGSNILLNLLRSHPDVCSPRGETNEVFRGKSSDAVLVRGMKILRYLPCMILERRDVFQAGSWTPRRRFTPLSRMVVDSILFHDKLRATDDAQNRWKYEGVEYTRREIAASRLLCKNLNGISFLTPEFSKMYPDATFIALVRNGFAVCEGHVRRGQPLDAIARKYELGCQLMLDHERTIPRYHIVRYEDVIASPRTMLETLYSLCDLQLSRVEKVRLESKRVVEKDGSHRVVHGVDWKKLIWYPLDEFEKHFRADANENQIARLTAEQKAIIERHCQRSLERFGYLAPVPSPIV